MMMYQVSMRTRNCESLSWMKDKVRSTRLIITARIAQYAHEALALFDTSLTVAKASAPLLGISRQ